MFHPDAYRENVCIRILSVNSGVTRLSLVFCSVEGWEKLPVDEPPRVSAGLAAVLDELPVVDGPPPPELAGLAVLDELPVVSVCCVMC